MIGITPICTTEHGYLARIKPGFDSRQGQSSGARVDPGGNQGEASREERPDLQ